MTDTADAASFVMMALTGTTRWSWDQPSLARLDGILADIESARTGEQLWEVYHALVDLARSSDRAVPVQPKEPNADHDPDDYPHERVNEIIDRLRTLRRADEETTGTGQDDA